MTGGTRGASAHARSRYLPPADAQGVALCLSGGGFRAALFHLGALTRLNQLGMLGSIDTVSCVSGGSILGALLAHAIDPWPTEGEVVPEREWAARVITPLVEFTARDLRTGPLARQLLHGFRVRSAAGPRGLEAHYRRGITERTLAELPARPRFVFCATDLVFGIDYTFERDRIGSSAGGYAGPDGIPIARAVAASSCFPPLFNPLPMELPVRDYRTTATRHRHVAHWARNARSIELTDGGDYDNLGLEPVWQRARVLLVSDGGSPFQVARDRGLPWRLQRYAEIATNQAVAVRKRWLISNLVSGQLRGAYWGIASTADHYGIGGDIPAYSEQLVKHRIASIRTDMDAFSRAEAQILQNHGYSLAAAAMAAHPPSGVGLTASPAAVPYPDLMDGDVVDSALAESDRRRILGREPWWRFPVKVVRG
jgi:NTE family protein